MKFATSLAFVIAASLSAASAFAADKPAANTLTPQQQKMSDCSKDAHAKDLKGDAYKSYMSTCMKGTTAATGATTKTSSTAATDAKSTEAKTADANKPKSDPFVSTGGNNAQQQKMKSCAADAKAKGLKGPDRRTFMQSCLKKDSAATPATPAK